MTTVSWKVADKQRDEEALKAFTCARRVPPNRRPYSWELEVQKYFHNEVWADTNESIYLGQRFRIAEDADGIAAAYTHSRLADQPPFPVSDGSQTRLMVMLGIATRYRWQGGKFADEVLLDALYDIQDSEPESAEIIVIGKVHMNNLPSQKMLKRADFEQSTQGSVARPLGLWRLTLTR
ncbi:hypothetical protein [Streptomyces globisporus]|uniref:hypothetical protein n=1 Tax=Streptomyces globisporus TaxID=1908 RepID=UPI0036F622B2